MVHTSGDGRAFWVWKGVDLRTLRYVDIRKSLFDDVFEPLDPSTGGTCEAVPRGNASARDFCISPTMQ
ncbi:uncharacterized protein ColSpa_01736 [Colletotrichum spaethianum]|uniref:Uncharacterized protein n=1 Tax=Colletotrichum spaethianum TaxID=700344 RepID=A0AA37NWP2_9PEZI|nr:uncharacterized protein ColSpa_01736 [Colletotrichum spaethianum]GKT41555.1 hypothetical protein ColSpa_01736 [Colletotrichum spaethianum]